LLDFVLFIRFV